MAGESTLLAQWGGSWCSGIASVGAVKGDSSARVEGTPPDCGGDTVFVPSPEIAVDCNHGQFWKKFSLAELRVLLTPHSPVFYTRNLDAQLRLLNPNSGSSALNIIIITEVPFEIRVKLLQQMLFFL